LPFAFFNLFYVGGDVVFGADLVEHSQNFFVGAAVKWPGKRGGSGRGCEIRIGMRTADRAHRIRAAILLVVGVQDNRMSSAREITGFATYFGSTIFHSMFMKFSVYVRSLSG